MGCVTEKTSLKLNELVITGFTHLRVKGKNVHIRTPRCRTLRRLNQLEGNNNEFTSLFFIIIFQSKRYIKSLLNLIFE